MTDAQKQPSPEEAVVAGRISPEGEVAPSGDELPQFVTKLTPIEQQVGVNVIAALQHPQTVAVLSSVAMGRDGTQRIVSIGLDPELVQQIQQMMMRAEEAKQPAPSVPCLGFQCYINNDQDDDADDKDDDKGDGKDADKGDAKDAGSSQ